MQLFASVPSIRHSIKAALHWYCQAGPADNGCTQTCAVSQCLYVYGIQPFRYSWDKLQPVHHTHCGACICRFYHRQPEASAASNLMVALLQALKKRRLAGSTSMGMSSGFHHRSPCSVRAWALAPRSWSWPLPSSCLLWLGCSTPTTGAPCSQPAWYAFPVPAMIYAIS